MLVSVDIYMTPQGGSKIQIPVNPEKLQIGSDAKFMTFSTISNGDVKIPHGKSPEEISWSGVFYGSSRKSMGLIKKYTSPNSLAKSISNWRDNGTKVTVVATNTNINGTYYVSSFKGKYSGGYGDINYDIKLIKAEEIVIYTTKELNTAKKKNTSTTTTRQAPKKTTKATTAKAKTTSYTIKRGDTLYGIAKKKLGNGNRYPEIYKLNKSKIESVAKKHGYRSSNNGNWIFPGTKLTIPVK